MAYYLSEERNQDVVGSYRRYQECLREHEREFPLGAFALGTSEWYQNANDHRCPHDGRLENVIISESSGSDQSRITTVRIRPLAAYHDGYIEFFYPKAFAYSIETVSCSTGGGDWLYDEFCLAKSGNLIHEIEWAGPPKGIQGSRSVIGASDVEFQWIPHVP
jgi:hypothetical protein